MHAHALLRPLIALLSLAAFSANAQDKIYFRDGSQIEARVKEISTRDIIYAAWQSKDSTEYAVAKRDVERIVFENGLVQSFDNRRLSPHEAMMRRRTAQTPERRNEPQALDNRKNILCFAPLQMTNESVAGVGIQYERVLDKNGYISFYLPVAFSFFQQNMYNYYGGSVDKSGVFTYVYPSLKFYPATSRHRVTYSVGPSFGLGFGTKYRTHTDYDPNTSTYIYTVEDHSVFKAGFMVNNGLNVQISNAFYLGVEGSLGIFYYDNEFEHFDLGGDEPMVQLNFKMGIRF